MKEWTFLLPLVTFAIILAVLVWVLFSTLRHKNTGKKPSGVGGANDPMAGASDDLRDPDAMRSGLDAARHRDAGHGSRK